MFCTSIGSNGSAAPGAITGAGAGAAGDTGTAAAGADVGSCAPAAGCKGITREHRHQPIEGNKKIYLFWLIDSYLFNIQHYMGIIVDALFVQVDVIT